MYWNMCPTLELLSWQSDWNLCVLLCQALRTLSRLVLCSSSGFYSIDSDCRRYDGYYESTLEVAGSKLLKCANRWLVVRLK